MEAERAREEERRRIEEEERMKLAVKESESQEAELIIVENLEQNRSWEGARDKFWQEEEATAGSKCLLQFVFDRCSGPNTFPLSYFKIWFALDLKVVEKHDIQGFLWKVFSFEENNLV